MLVDVLIAVNILFHDRIPIQTELQMMGKQKSQCKTQMFSANVTGSGPASHVLLAKTELGLCSIDTSSCDNRLAFVLAIIFAPAAFAVAAHFTTSRRVLVLVDRAIAASIPRSIVVVLFKRRLKGR